MVRQSTSLNNLEMVSYMKGILGFQTLPQLSCLELNDKSLHDVGGRTVFDRNFEIYWIKKA